MEKDKINRVLNNEASEQDAREVAQWFGSVEGQLEASLMLEADMEALVPHYDAPVRCERVRNINNVSRWWRVAAVVAMVLMVGAGLGGYFWHPELSLNNPSQIVKIQTGVGEHSTAVLPDGTEVALNAMTSVTYDCSMRNGKRQVSVEGEAYFDVAKDAEHPFVIDANQMEVTCLGTALNVRNYADEQTSSVVLVEGKVRVTTENGDLTMEPDSRVECDKESLLLSKSKVLASNYTYWLKGETRYNNQSLENIARELARNYHINVIITSDELKEQHFTGYLGSCSLRNVLDILTITSDMAYHIDGESVYIYARNTKK